MEAAGLRVQVGASPTRTPEVPFLHLILLHFQPELPLQDFGSRYRTSPGFCLSSRYRTSAFVLPSTLTPSRSTMSQSLRLLFLLLDLAAHRGI
ncbi:MAG: hypothetical protein ACK56I_10135, partial [bacterium]